MPRCTAMRAQPWHAQVCTQARSVVQQNLAEQASNVLTHTSCHPCCILTSKVATCHAQMRHTNTPVVVLDHLLALGQLSAALLAKVWLCHVLHQALDHTRLSWLHVLQQENSMLQLHRSTCGRRYLRCLYGGLPLQQLRGNHRTCHQAQSAALMRTGPGMLIV